LEPVDKLITPLNTQYNSLVRNSGKVISKRDLTQLYEDAISPYLNKKILTGEDQKVAERILQEYSTVLKQIARYGDEIPLDAIAENKSAYFTSARGNRLIAPSKANMQESLGQASRNTVERAVPGSKALGNQLHALDAYRKIAEDNLTKGSTGNSVKLPTLGGATVGGVVGGLPGAVVGSIGMNIVNRPTTQSFISRGLEKAGSGMTSATTKGINPTVGAVTRNTLINTAVKKPKKTFQKSRITYPSMDLKGY
jgi:hypothetical protein